MRSLLDELGDRLDPGGARELAELAELLLGVGGARQHGDDEPPLRLDRRSVGASSTRRLCQACPMASLAERLAARTLELVDIPRRAGARPRSPHTCARSCRPRSSSNRESEDARFGSSRGATGIRSSSWPVTTTPSRRRRTFRAGSRRMRCTAWRERHEGWPRGAARAGPRPPREARGRADIASARCSARKSSRRVQPLPELFDALPRGARGRARDPARADRARSRPAASAT